MRLIPIILLLFSCLPGSAMAESFSGQIVGIHCASLGQLCPANKLERHITDEPQFVLLGVNREFYRLTNISRDTLVRQVSKQVIVSGIFACIK